MTEDRKEALMDLEANLFNGHLLKSDLYNVLEASDIINFLTEGVIDPDEFEQDRILTWVLYQIPLSKIRDYLDGI